MTGRLLDTEVCIDVLRGRDPSARLRLSRMRDSVAVSSVTVAELAHGAARSSEPDRNAAEVRLFTGALTVLDLDEDAAWHAGDIRQALAAAGTPIGGYDILIAAHALASGRVLVTGNVGEFGRVPGLRVEAW